MRVKIIAVGRLKSGPEHALIQDYAKRFGKMARGLGMSALEIIEIDERKAQSKTAQGAALIQALPKDGVIWACDERGDQISSPEFASGLSKAVDAGRPEFAILIGGADGLDADVLTHCNKTMSFGRAVWPHMLVRVMLSEQIYRAASILNGSPYHRV